MSFVEAWLTKFFIVCFSVATTIVEVDSLGQTVVKALEGGVLGFNEQIEDNRFPAHRSQVVASRDNDEKEWEVLGHHIDLSWSICPCMSLSI